MSPILLCTYVKNSLKWIFIRRCVVVHEEISKHFHFSNTFFWINLLFWTIYLHNLDKNVNVCKSSFFTYITHVTCKSEQKIFLLIESHYENQNNIMFGRVYYTWILYICFAPLPNFYILREKRWKLIQEKT